VIEGGEWQPEKTPILRRFVGKVGEEADRAFYYEQRQQVKDREAGVAQAKKDLRAGNNVEQAKEFITEASQENRQKAIFEHADGQMKKLRKQEAEINANSALSSADRHDKLAIVRQDMRKVQNEARAASAKLKQGASAPTAGSKPGRLDIDTTEWGQK
jgi:hypothetical protein